MLNFVSDFEDLNKRFNINTLASLLPLYTKKRFRGTPEQRALVLRTEIALKEAISVWGGNEIASVLAISSLTKLP
jgi:hypothetical protein